VTHVHTEGDLRLATIPAEVALADKDANEIAALEVGKVRCSHDMIVSP